VEHFRPKAGYRQQAGDSLQRPGYYWLAYEWSNLLFCCQICNQRHKQNLFPLAAGSQRAVCHRDGIRGERPLFINPAAENPTRWIGFREEYPYARNGDPRGDATIDALGLNRQALVERRRDLLKTIRHLKECRALLAREIRQARRTSRPPPTGYLEKIGEIDALFAEMKKDSAEYALMARAALRGLRKMK
jgi:hypothetical protein